MEKDWGKSFPLYLIWLQSNHFDTPETSLMLSVQFLTHGEPTATP